MSVLETYETAETLSKLPHGVPLSNNCIRCVVADVIPSRTREFMDGRVFSLTGEIRANAADGQKDERNRVRFHFYDDWAAAASFVDPGDVLILRGVMLVDIPRIPGDPEGDSFFITPLPQAGYMRALQEGEKGDTMEVTVTPDNFDIPRVRVLPRSDCSNHCYVNDVKKHYGS